MPDDPGPVSATLQAVLLSIVCTSLISVLEVPGLCMTGSVAACSFTSSKCIYSPACIAPELLLRPIANVASVTPLLNECCRHTNPDPFTTVGFSSRVLFTNIDEDVVSADRQTSAVVNCFPDCADTSTATSVTLR